MISTTYGHTWITFENGYTVSIFNGFGSYSENHFNHKLFEKYQQHINPLDDSCDSKTAEIAITYKDLGFCTSTFIETNDSVIGYVSPEELVDILVKVKEAK